MFMKSADTESPTLGSDEYAAHGRVVSLEHEDLQNLDTMLGQDETVPTIQLDAKLLPFLACKMRRGFVFHA